MAKIVIIGVGSSQHRVIEKMHKEIPDAKCIHIDCNWYNMKHSEGIIHHNLFQNSDLAYEIFSSFHPGSAREIARKNIKPIVEEQTELIKELLD